MNRCRRTSIAVPPSVRRWLAGWGRLVSAAALCIALTLRRLAGWFLSEPQRITVAVSGLVVCVVSGSLAGVAIGFVLERAVFVVTSLVDGP